MGGAWEDEFDEDELDDENTESIYLKYCFDGVSSLPELAWALRALAEDIDCRTNDGWQLEGYVDSGWAHLALEDSKDSFRRLDK